MTFNGLQIKDAFIKRFFDIIVSAIGLFCSWWLIGIAYLLASKNTGEGGFFCQTRIGRNGVPFKIVKIRSMRKLKGFDSVVTTDKDPRITRMGRFWRKSKIDELPQLINVFKGEMSFVGPRPDVPGFADSLRGEDRLILTVRPGITGPATLKYRNEEELLLNADFPEDFNREIIFPDKVHLNLNYLKEYKLSKDIRYILETIFS